MRTSSLRDSAYTSELLNCGHDRRINEVLLIGEETFDSWVDSMKREDFLHATKPVAIEEQLTMFISTLYQGLSNRAIQVRFQQSGELLGEMGAAKKFTLSHLHLFMSLEFSIMAIELVCNC
jgi:site-specific recombinase XerC